jgi:DNA polymerase III subunit gamma/tau
LDQLSKVWTTYADKLRQEEKAAELSVVNQAYELKEDYHIIIKLSNSLQEDIFERFRMDFVRYLRQSLNNNQIKLATEIVQEEVKQRLYTAQDKFNYMAQKNPKLIDLRLRLGLDL